MSSAFFSSFFSFFPIVALGAILSVGLSLAQKRPEFLAYGCGGIFLSVFIVGLILTICQFDERHYKILRNVYVPTIDGYSEIDVLLLHETGIYVFESKNLSESVYGDEKHPQWQRYKTNGEKGPIPNPMQAEQIFYSAETIDDWCRMLLPYTQLSEEEKKAHVERITKKFGKIN